MGELNKYSWRQLGKLLLRLDHFLHQLLPSSSPPPPPSSSSIKGIEICEEICTTIFLRLHALRPTNNNKNYKNDKKKDKNNNNVPKSVKQKAVIDLLQQMKEQGIPRIHLDTDHHLDDPLLR